MRGLRWLSTSLGVALVVLAMSWVGGGGSAVLPAGAQPATQTVYYHHEGGGLDETAARIRIRAHHTNYPNRSGNTVTVTVTPPLGRMECDAAYGDDAVVGTYEIALPTTAGAFTDLTFTRNGPNRLVKLPVGSSPGEECIYTVTFPQTEDGPTDFFLLDTSWDDYDTTIGTAPVGGGPGDGEAWARYVNNPTPSEYFTGTIFMETSADVARLTQFFVDVRQVTSGTGSTAPGCSRQQRARVRTQEPGTTVERRITLVHRRHGSVESCVYEVTWPRHEDAADDYIKDPSFSFTTRLSKALADRNPPQGARGRYIANPDPTPLAETRFAPEVAWRVPVVDYDGDGAHDYGATSPRTSITVRYSPAAVSSTLRCSPADTAITYAIVPSTQAPPGETGPVTNFEVTSSTRTLIDSPNGARQRCRYEATFDAGDMGQQSLRLAKEAHPSDDTELWGGEPSVAATYINASRARSVTFRVNADTGANGLVFRVSFAAVSGADGGCSASGTAEVTVGSDGTGEASRDLVDWPEGHDEASDRCEYTISWDGSEAAATSTYPRFGSATDALDGDVFDQTTPTMSKRYGAAEYYWAGNLFRGLELYIIFTTEAVTHPDWWHPRVGAPDFTVEIEPTDASPEGCTTGVTHEFELTWQPDEGQQLSWGFYQDEFVLSPPGTSEQCSYDIIWPEVEDGNTALFIKDPSYRPAGGTTIVPSDNRTQRLTRWQRYTPRTYTATFVPDFTLRIPDLDLDDDGANDFSGTHIEVNFRAVTGSLGDSGCARSTRVIYEVDDDGNAAPTEPFTLSGRRSDPRRPCIYSADIDSSKPANTGVRAGQLHNDIDLATHCSDLQVGISLADDPGIACLRTRRTTTEAVFTANGADVPDGTTFTVELTKTTSSHRNCTESETVSVVTGTDDSSATVELVDWPVDRWSRLDQRCAYDVEWSTNEAAGGTAYVRDDSRAPTVTDNRNSAESQWLHNAWYMPMPQPQPPTDQQQQPLPPPMVQEVTPQTTFIATLQLVAAPDVPGGTSFNIGVAPVSGSHGDCSTPPATPIAAPSPDPSGASDRSRTREIDLVDKPAGEVTHCVYTVTWPPNERNPGATPSYLLDSTYREHSTVLSAAPGRSTTASARYAPVPDTSGDGDTGTTSSNGGGTTSSNGDGTGTQNGGDTGTQNGGDTGNQNGDGNEGNTQTGAPQTGAPQTGPVSQTPTNTGVSAPRPSARTGGGVSRGGGGSRGGSSGGGSSGGGSGGGGATGPWVAASTRVPVAVSVTMPEREFSVGTAIEIMLNVPGTCGDDITAFAGLPAEVGLVYAITARSGTTADMLAADALRLASHAERGDSTRACELRITLISAPAGCRLDGASTDEAGRTYVDLSGGDDIASYAATPTLTCT